MGNIIVSNSFVTVSNTNITSLTENIDYPKINVMDYWHLKRRFRTNELFDVTSDDARYILKFDFGVDQIIDGLFLNDINFNKVRIYGSKSASGDLGTDWQAAAFDSGENHSVTLDERVNRYKIYLPLTSFNHRYLAIVVPTAASAVGDYKTNAEIGTVVFISASTIFTFNMDYGYERSSSKAYKEIALGTESVERVALADNLKWNGSLSFSARTLSNETDLWTLNRMDNAGPLFFYENQDDDDKAYICVRDDDYSGTWSSYNIVTGNSIKLKELV